MKNLLGFSISIILLVSCQKEDDCIKPEACSLTPDPGMCKAYIPKYYYDQADGKCKEFIWGGCGGVVPFNTPEECKACECSPSAE